MLNQATFEVFGTVRKVERGRDGRKWLRLIIPVDRSYTEPHRVSRRQFCLDHAAMAGPAIWSSASSGCRVPISSPPLPAPHTQCHTVRQRRPRFRPWRRIELVQDRLQRGEPRRQRIRVKVYRAVQELDESPALIVGEIDRHAPSISGARWRPKSTGARHVDRHALH
jgi:hypothetical protein